MATVAPSWTLISISVPATGEGISASTLSVEISKIGSSRLTASPTFFNHLVIVPSAIDSPICGMMTWVAMFDLLFATERVTSPRRAGAADEVMQGPFRADT
jgi:hypothetical protein